MCLQGTHNRIAECIYSSQRLPLTGPVTLAGLVTTTEFCSTFPGGCTKEKACWTRDNNLEQRVLYRNRGKKKIKFHVTKARTINM